MKNEIICEDFDIKLRDLKTPCYIVDKNRFSSNYFRIAQPFESEWGRNLLFGYSIKTNHSNLLLDMAKELGMWAEAVSDDEYDWALKCGYQPENIIFNGPQKSKKLLIDAIKKGSIVNLDNMEEIEMLLEEYQKIKECNARVGLRVNFDLESECPDETTAGVEVSRFGFCLENGELYNAISRLQSVGIQVNGLHMHYSSKSRSLNIFRSLAKKAASIVKEYQLQPTIEYIDIGGGFFMGEPGIVIGRPEMEQYAKVISDELKREVDSKKVKLILEPGASLIATSVTYLSKVLNVRDIRNVRVLTLDGSDLHINPFMAKREPVYKILTKRKEDKIIPKQIICGATCMENDRIANLENAPVIEKDDYIYCSCVGAYTMAFNSCFINLPPYIYLKDKEKYQLCRAKNSEVLSYA